MDVNKYIEGNLHCYKLVAGKPAGDAAALTDNSQERLHTYLDWAKVLLEGSNKYSLLRYTPDLVAKPFTHSVTNANWIYNVVSNDFTGLGVDKGFEGSSANKEASITSLLFKLSSPEQLKNLPEDMFGDFASHVSFFGLQSGREESTKHFLSTNDSPDLGNWLQPDEIFIHITVGKEQGYYDAFLVKAGKDISDKLDKLQV